MVGMKSVLPHPWNKETHERIEKIESNKFSSSGGENNSEEEEASKGQESREMDTNTLSCNDKAKSGEHVLNRPPKKTGGRDMYKNNTATTMSCEAVSEQDNSRKTIPELLGEMEIPDILQMEKETNQDKKGPLSWNDYLGDPSMRPCHKDKRKNQVTTTAEKEDDTDSTDTVTTAAFTSVCELEQDDDIAERLAETTTLNNQIYVFGKRQ